MSWCVGCAYVGRKYVFMSGNREVIGWMTSTDFILCLSLSFWFPNIVWCIKRMRLDWKDKSNSRTKLQSYATNIYFTFYIFFFRFKDYCTFVKWRIKRAHYLRISTISLAFLTISSSHCCFIAIAFDFYDKEGGWREAKANSDGTSSTTFIFFYCQSYFSPTICPFSLWPLLFSSYDRDVFIVCSAFIAAHEKWFLFVLKERARSRSTKSLNRNQQFEVDSPLTHLPFSVLTELKLKSSTKSTDFFC